MKDKSKFMLRAIELSIQSAKTKGGPFGCVIVKENKIIAEGDFIKLELSEKQAKNWKQHLALEQGTELDTSDIVLSDKDYYEYRLNSNAAKIF